jgi:hypothetical protein
MNVAFNDGSHASAGPGTDLLTDTVIQAEGVKNLTPATLGHLEPPGRAGRRRDRLAVRSGRDRTSGIVSAPNRR